MKSAQVRRNANRLVMLLVALTVAAAGVTVAVGAGGWTFQPNGTIRYGGGMSGPGLAPYGSVNQMPYGSPSYIVGNHPYYWHGGGWYSPAYYGADLYYYPVSEPVHGVVGSVPTPYEMVNTRHGVLYVHNGVYFQPFMHGGTTWYRVVAVQ